MYGVFGFKLPSELADKDKPRLFKAKFNKIFMKKFDEAAKKLNEPHPARDIRKILSKLNSDADILKKLSTNIEAIPRKAAGDIKTALLKFNKSRTKRQKDQWLKYISVILDLFLTEQKLQQKLMPLIRERLKGG